MPILNRIYTILCRLYEDNSRAPPAPAHIPTMDNSISPRAAACLSFPPSYVGRFSGTYIYDIRFTQREPDDGTDGIKKMK